MGLRERIRQARGSIVLRAVRVEARRKALLAQAIAQSTDGGLLVHVAIEQGA